MNWNDISVNQYYQLQKVNDEFEDDFDRRLAMLAILSNQTFDDVVDLKISEINKLSKKFDFINTPIKTKVVTMWNGYRFIIKLSDLKAGQMIDLLETCKEDVNNNLHRILAILDISDKDRDVKEKELLNCPITIVQGISNFFFRKYNLSPQVIQDYSLNKLREMNRKVEKMSREISETL